MEDKFIVCFDVHTRAQHKFARLTEEFYKQGYTIILVHCGSLGHDKKTRYDYYYRFIRVLDISHFNYSLSKVFNQYSPHLTIFLSTRSIFQMAAIAFCKKQKIPSLHSYHGLVSVQNTDSTAYSNSTSILLKQVSRKFFKNIFVMYPFYYKNVFRLKNILRDTLALIQLVKFQLGSDPNNYIINTGTSFGSVYTESDVYDIKIKYRISSQNIVIGGNPDLSNAFEKDSGHSMNLNYLGEFGIYIDTCLYGSNLVFTTVKDWASDLEKSLSTLGVKHWYWKPHPANNRGVIEAIAQSCSLEVINSDDFYTYLSHASIVLSESTSLFMAAAIRKKTIALPNSGMYGRISYGKVILSYPKIQYSSDYQLISHTKEIDERCNEWIEKNIGPNPAFVSKKLFNKYHEITRNGI